MGRFKKGLFLGGLFGAGLTWLNVTKKGKETRAQLLDSATAVYEEVKEKAVASGALDKMTKNKYMAMVKEAVDKYAVKNGMAESVKKLVTKVVGAQYKNVKKKK